MIVRSVWRADVELEPWEPRFETRYRCVVRPADLLECLTISDGLARTVSRALREAAIGEQSSADDPI